MVQLDFAEGIGAACLGGLKRYHDRVLMSSLVPVLVVILNWVAYGMRLLMSSRTDDQRQQAYNQHMRFFLIATYVVYPTISMLQFRGLTCQEDELGVEYLTVEPATRCDSKEYREFQTKLWFYIVIYQLIPVTYLALLAQVKDRLNPSGSAETDLMRFRYESKHDKTITPLRFLVGPYKSEYWWFDGT